ncbi:MAG: VWA domain-containing protein [Acidobacteriota bacterium]|nr:VWA domain-containing protein [Acidobacteriota bacterium]
MKAKRVLIATFLGVLGLMQHGSAQQGPNSDSSTTIAKPRKPSTDGNTPAADPNQAKIPSKFNKPKDATVPESVPTFRSDAITVTVDTAVLDNKGHFIPNIPKQNFRIMEDGVPQQIAGFSLGEAPITVCLLIEFSNRFQNFYSEAWFQTLTAAYGFVQTLKPDDYVAVIAYDLREEILSDFTNDRQQTAEAMARLRIAGFSESNMYDALVDTEQRMQDIEGRKAIVLIASGIDTFSKLTYDKTRRAIQDAGVPIYAIGLMQSAREMAEASGALSSLDRMDFIQADNQMRTFAAETGGMSYFPRFYSEFPGIFQSIQQTLRSNYVLSYNPSNQARDGKVRRIKVELINPETNEPIRLNDDKGKPIKYKVVAKTGYTAPREVE